MRVLFLIFGVILLALGLLWVGQGLGVIQWPHSSFMIGQVLWTRIGAAVAIFGALVVFVFARSRRR